MMPSAVPHLSPANDQVTNLDRMLEVLRGWHAFKAGVPFAASESDLWREGWMLRSGGQAPGPAQTLSPPDNGALA